MDTRKIALGLAAFAAGAVAWMVGVARFAPKPGERLRLPPPAAEHVPIDLLGDTRPDAGDRAPPAFRPDPTAVPTLEEREALRPATGPARSLAADRGSGFSEATGAA